LVPIEWLDGLKNGRGRLLNIHSGKLIYEGEFRFNIPEGM
jgi:hypothetical protein